MSGCKRNAFPVWAFLLAAVLASPSGVRGEPGPDSPSPVAETLRTRILAAGEPLRLRAGTTPIRAAATLARFYRERGFEPAWQTEGGWTPQARELADALRASMRQGLDPADYHGSELEEMLAAPPPGTDDPGAADAELLLTDAYLLLASHYLAGRLDPVTIDPEWLAARSGADLAAHLARALPEGRIRESLESLLPRHPEYGALVDLLARYRAAEAAGGWPAAVPPGPKLERGAEGPRVAALRARLQAAGSPRPAAADQATLFDADLEAAVRRFQETHGLEADGVVGPATLAELNRTPAQRVRQIEVNLERWRWLPEDLGRRHVLVNIAGFELHAVEQDRPVLHSKVIVGRQYRRTPVFSDRISYLVLSPSWDVPRRIAAQDKLPLFQKDPDALTRGRYLLLQDGQPVDPSTVDWSALDPSSFPYRLRQRPGPQNALGRIKLMFPNRFNVYLHDTPDRELFDRGVRTFSSGCIRVQKPVELATWVLAETPGWDRQSLEAAIETGVERRVPVPTPVPVHILYRTAWVDEEGKAQFRPDVYARDERVAKALEQRPPGS